MQMYRSFHQDYSQLHILPSEILLYSRYTVLVHTLGELVANFVNNLGKIRSCIHVSATILTYRNVTIIPYIRIKEFTIFLQCENLEDIFKVTMLYHKSLC